jgi:uncharacterized protein (DUF362 family)
MSQHSRREFIVRSAAAGTLAFGAGGLLASEAATPEMTIAKWTGANASTSGQIDRVAAQLTEKAIEGLGGIRRFVSRGSVVWVKPNIGWDRAPELAANTNPAVVATVVRLCFEAGAKTVKVGDNPCDLPEKTYVASGIPDAVRPLGAKVVRVDRRRFRKTSVGGQRMKTMLLYPEILDCDLVINVPIVKHHGLATCTLCMKNYLGVIENRGSFHQALPECIADLTRFMQPRTALHVLDGVRILKNHGPKGGNPADVVLKTTVAAGVDPVALDAFGAELMGRKPTDVGTVVKGSEAGLGTMDYRSLALREIAVS